MQNIRLRESKVQKFPEIKKLGLMAPSKPKYLCDYRWNDCRKMRSRILDKYGCFFSDHTIPSMSNRRADARMNQIPTAIPSQRGGCHHSQRDNSANGIIIIPIVLVSLYRCPNDIGITSPSIGTGIEAILKNIPTIQRLSHIFSPIRSVFAKAGCFA